jgi:uncharacterized membrane protein YkvA (DUF1232 family)
VPWYGWLIVAVVAFVVVTLLCLRAVRATQRGRRFLALPVRAKLRFGRLLLADRRAGWPARLTLLALVAYLALPFDLIPDFLPVVGQLDDAAVLFIAIAVLILVIPRERFEDALDEAEAAARERSAAGSAGGPGPTA